ncbi:MAG: DinB family protein [Gemmatimonadota bacterium]|jgi:uncharacterized damage-inducible protein DinB
MSNRAFFQGLLSQERDIFVRVAKAVLEEGQEYRPDPKSRCARELIEHLIGHNLDLVELIDDGVINHRNQVPFESLDDGVRQLDESFGMVIEKLDTIDDEQWLEPAKFMFGDHLITEGPRQQLAWMMLLDAVHHRGQLSTHLRAMGSTVPSMYGPSADTQPAH